MTQEELNKYWPRIVACARTTVATIRRRIIIEGWPEEAIVPYIAELRRELKPITDKYPDAPPNPPMTVGRPPKGTIDKTFYLDTLISIRNQPGVPPFESSPFAELYQRAQSVGNNDITIAKCRDMYYTEYFVSPDDDQAAFWAAYVRGIKGGYLTPFLPELVPDDVKEELRK